MSFLKTSDGTEIYYEDWGGGKPIVFIHGWPLSSSMWEYQRIPLAAAGFRCIAYDRRGFGQSSKPYTGYDFATLGADLSQLVSALDLHDATLAGFSMGGGELVEYLTRHNGEGRVTRAALISSVVPYMLKMDDNPNGVDITAFDEMRQGLTVDRPAFLTEFAEKFFGIGMISSPISMPMLASTCEVAMLASPRATLAALATFSETDFRKAVRSITVPTLIIHGDADATVPIAPTSHQAAELIANAELKIYPGAPHGLFYTHRDDLNRDLAAFVSEGRMVLDAAA